MAEKITIVLPSRRKKSVPKIRVWFTSGSAVCALVAWMCVYRPNSSHAAHEFLIHGWNGRIPFYCQCIGSILSFMSGFLPKAFWEIEENNKWPVRLCGIGLSVILGIGAASSYLQDEERSKNAVTKSDLAPLATKADLRDGLKKFGVPALSRDEIEKRKKIRDQLGNFRLKLLAYEGTARFGWDNETRKRNHQEDPSPEIEQYLKENLGGYYSARFMYPNVEDLSKKKYDPNPYIGQGESEAARAKIRFLDKIAEDLK